MSLETTTLIDYAKKQGWNIGFIIVILWQNSRLEKVEEKLFNCYTARQISHQKQVTQNTEYFAILPNEVTIRNTKRYSKA